VVGLESSFEEGEVGEDTQATRASYLGQRGATAKTQVTAVTGGGSRQQIRQRGGWCLSGRCWQRTEEDGGQG
jgi:hypothetical protein